MPNSPASLFRQNAERFPDKPAFIHPKRGGWQVVTYRQLSGHSDLLARGLTAHGIQPGARAAVMVPAGVDLFALVFAMLQTGVAPVIVDPAIVLSRVTVCLAEAQPEVFIGSALAHGIRRLYGWGRESLRLNLTVPTLARAGRIAREAPQVTMKPGDAAAVIYTSGSTGLPKGAIYTHANFAAQVGILVNVLQLTGDAVDLPAFPLFALIDCLLGVTAVIPDMRFPPPAKVDPARMAEAMQQHGVNSLFVSPAALERLARYGAEKNIRFDGLERVITAGAPAPADVLERFAGLLPPEAKFLGVYGATEALPISVVDSREIARETRRLSAQGAGICIGRPAPGMEVGIIPIVDDAVAEAQWLPAGQVGEITVRGAAVTAGYVGREELNRLAKIPAEDGSVIHRTGDAGYFDEAGRLWYCGRKSHRVKIGEETLFSERVEGIFNAHPLVHRAALVGVEKAGGTEPVLWVELKRSARRTDRGRVRAELLALAKVHEGAGRIQTILFQRAFPTDVRHNSKIIREQLAELARRKR